MTIERKYSRMIDLVVEMSVIAVFASLVWVFGTQIRSVPTAVDGTLLLEPEPGYNQTDYSLVPTAVSTTVRVLLSLSRS